MAELVDALGWGPNNQIGCGSSSLLVRTIFYLMKKNIFIIGSGFSSLSAACYLASEGNNVTVFEKNNLNPVHFGHDQESKSWSRIEIEIFKKLLKYKFKHHFWTLLRVLLMLEQKNFKIRQLFVEISYSRKC